MKISQSSFEISSKVTQKPKQNYHPKHLWTQIYHILDVFVHSGGLYFVIVLVGLFIGILSTSSSYANQNAFARNNLILNKFQLLNLITTTINTTKVTKSNVSSEHHHTHPHNIRYAYEVKHRLNLNTHLFVCAVHLYSNPGKIFFFGFAFVVFHHHACIVPSVCASQSVSCF